MIDLYGKVMVGLDASRDSDMALEASLLIAKGDQAKVLGCHVYASDLHRRRFQEMETGLPAHYQTEQKLEYLRDVHEDIISSGLKMISDSYISPLIEKGRAMGIEVEGSTPEGRNYVQFMRVAREWGPDLIVMGANGLGHVPEGTIGSMTERTLLSDVPSDILIVREPFDLKDRPIVVGVDGSPESYHALRKASHLAEMFDTRIEAVAVYDPYFHGGVFSAIARTLTSEDQKRFNLTAQEKLHDEIIDKGLATIYREGLERGVSLLGQSKVRVEQHVIAGKPYPQLFHFAALSGASMVVVGKRGLHAEASAPIGSNALNLARIGGVNLLVVSTPSGPLDVPTEKEAKATKIPWSEGAEKLIARVPPFAQGMARNAVERRAMELGRTEVDEQLVLEVSGKMGMGSNKGTSRAERVVLKKIKRLAPGFHEHIARSKIIGQTVKVGDKVLVYEVVETFPEGTVTVTEDTTIEMR